MQKEVIQGRFEVKPRNKHLNDTLRSKRSEPHEDKAGDFQKRSRLTKHFQRTVQEWLEDGEDFDYSEVY